MTSAGRVARSIEAKYGRAALLGLARGLQAGVPHRELAVPFGVTSPRVWQWSKALGYRLHSYQVHPSILAITREP